MTQFSSPVDLNGLDWTSPDQTPQAPQTSSDVDDFTRVAKTLANNPTAPEHVGEADPARFTAVASALANLPPTLQNQLDTDPAGASAALGGWIRSNIQGDQSAGTPEGATAISQAYQSVYGQRAMTAQGGTADQQAYMQQLASQRGELGNFAAGAAQGAAGVGLDVVGAFAPQTANALGQNVNSAYNTDTSRFSGKAGEFVGATAASLPAIVTPGAAVPAFAAMGAGGARRDVAQRRAEGQDISTGSEVAYAGTSGIIQGLVAHYLGQVMNGTPGQVPLQNLIRSFSPELLQSIQGTDGAVIRPLVQRTLLNAGVGSTQQEIALIAQEVAKSATNVAGQNDASLGSRIASETPQALLEGAAQGAAFHLHSEASTPGQFSPTETGEPAQAPSPEDKSTVAPATPQPPPAVSPDPNAISDSSDFFAAPQEASSTPQDVQPEQLQSAVAKLNDTLGQQPELQDNRGEESDTPDAGNQLPIDQSSLEQRIRESDDMLKRVNDLTTGGAEPLQGRLPNETDLKTGEAPDPSFLKLKALDPRAEVADPGPHAELFADVEKATGTKIIPVTSEKAAGFSDPDNPDTVLVNVRDPKAGVWNAVSHEVAHTFQYEFPEEFAAVRDRLPQWFKKEAETTYKGMLKKQGHSKEAIDAYWKKAGPEEIVSMAFGESAVKSKMLQRQLRGDNEGLWNGIRNTVEKVLNKFTSGGRIINDISDALHEGIGLRKGKNTNQVQEEAKAYAASKGLKYAESGNQPLDTERSTKIAKAYEEAKHEPDNPTVKKSYDAFKQETLDQFNFLRKQGVKFEPHEGEGQPYTNSAEMVKDVQDNKHLSYFSGGDMPADHPLAEKTGEKINSKDVTYNDAFRAVHDYFGHAAEGFQFGPRGEDNAFRAHAKLYSEVAKPAMAAETRGQNSYVNFGPDAEHNRANPAETKFAPQKATVLPSEFYGDEGRQSPRNYLSIGHKFTGDEDLWWHDEGSIETAPVDRAKGAHVQHGAEDADFRGRVDHQSKEISIAASPEAQDSSFYTRRVKGIADKLESKYPGYKVFIAEKGGLTPADEVTSGRMYPTLDKVKEIEESKPLLEKAKDIYNAATPANAWRFGKAVGDTMKRGLSDSLSDFVDAARVIDKNKPVSEVPLEAYIRLHTGLTDRIGKMRQAGVRRLFGDVYTDPKTGEGMNREWQLDPVKQAVERLPGTATKAERKTEAYGFTNFAMKLGVAERTLELAKRGTDKLTGIGGTGFTADDVTAANDFIAAAKKEPNYDLASEFLRRYRLMGTAHLDVLLQSGRISRDTAHAIRTSNEFYTNLQRVMEKTGTIDPSQSPSGMLHKFRGSDRDIDNPYINQQMTTERSYRDAERNYVVKSFIEQAKNHLSNPPVEVQKTAGDTVDVYENGEKKTYKVDPMVAEAINGWGKHITSDGVRLIGKVLGAPGRSLLFLTHVNPTFHINNLIKSFRSRAVLSPESGGLKSVSTEIQGLKDADTRNLVSILGGTFGGRSEYAGTRATYEKITKKALDNIANDPNAILALPQKAWKGYNKFAAFSEGVGRTAEYTAQYNVAKRRGMADQDARTYAAWKARDLMDFAVSGSWVKAINEIAYVPFLSAQFRGLSRHLEAIQSDPKGYAKRMAAFGVLPALLPAIYAYSQGKEQWDKYKGIPLTQRIMFDNYMIGNQRIVIPRGEIVSSASMVAELLFQNHFDVNDIFRALAGSQVPAGVDNPDSLLPLRGVREAKSNYSWFYDRNIIPPDEEGVALDLRKTDSASPLAKAISFMAQKAGMELDPRKIEHVMNTDAGGAGSTANSVSRLTDSKGLSTAKKAQMIGGFERTDPGYSDQAVQKVLTTATYLKDTDNPAIKSIKASLASASSAPDVDARQKFVDQARGVAEQANQFYDDNRDTILKVKKFGEDISEAKAAYDALKTGDARAQYVQSNPDQMKLLQQQKDYERINTRINELRKVQVTPTIADSTKKIAASEITRLYALLTKMSGN